MTETYRGENLFEDNGPAVVAGNTAVFGLINLLVVAAFIAMLAGGWKMFAKAGRPGWYFLIPIVNSIELFKIAGRPGWWVLLLIVPFVNVFVALITAVDLAKAFGRSVWFGFFMLILLAPLGFAVLGFGKDRYIGPTA